MDTEIFEHEWQGPVDEFLVGQLKNPRATERLMRYWSEGPGAAKVRWGVPGDFLRCVGLLRKYFPLNPKGLCANLHHRALGVWPGQEDGGRGHHALIDGEMTLVASADPGLDYTQPMHWMAILCPIGEYSSDGRMMLPGAVSHRDTPLPLSWQQNMVPSSHQGAEIVGRITDIDYTDDHVLGMGDLFSPDDVPAVAQFVTLAKAGVVGLSVDPGGSYAVQMAEDDSNGNQRMEFSKYTIGGATAVGRPSFPGNRLIIWNEPDSEPLDHLKEQADATDLEDDEIYPILAAAYAMCPDCMGDFAVMASGWESLPVASREYRWSADAAVQRIAAWANGDAKKLQQIFLWKDNTGSDTDMTTYKLPVADIIDGRPVMVYSAVYHAAAIVQGGHGGLPQVNDKDRAALRSVLTAVYAKISDAYKTKIPAPWDRASTTPSEPHLVLEDTMEATFAVNEEGWNSLPLAPSDTVWRSGAAIKQLADRAGVKGDNPSWQKYGQGFLWHASNPTEQGDFKLPICRVVDGHLEIVPRAVNAVASVLGGGRGGVDIPDSDKSSIAAIIARIQKRIQGGSDASTEPGAMALVAGAPLAPPRSWFEDPHLNGKTKIQIDEEGRVFGHLADWSTCHLGISNRCVMAPHSHNEYADFHVGTVVTAEGDMLDVGNLTANTGHAALNLTAGATKEHYDNTGTQVAVVRAGEDAFGIWVAGALVPELDIEPTAALMRRAPLSGDWRTVDGQLSLVAVLHVNRPGFQIRPGFAVDQDEELVAIVAAGVLHPDVEETFTYTMPGGGAVTHTPPVQFEVSEDDAQAARIARLNRLVNGPVRVERLKKITEGEGQ